MSRHNNNILQLAFDERLTVDQKEYLKSIYSQYQKDIQDPASKNGHPDDSGFNLFFPMDIQFNVNSAHYVGMGVNARLYVNGEPSGFYLYPRSSISKYPLELANSIGLIDSGYRGEITGVIRCVNDTNVIFKNGVAEPKKTEFKLVDGKINVPRGTSLLQISAPNLSPLRVEFVEKLDDTTSRGTGGFGSTTNSIDTGYSYGYPRQHAFN